MAQVARAQQHGVLQMTILYCTVTTTTCESTCLFLEGGTRWSGRSSGRSNPSSWKEKYCLYKENIPSFPCYTLHSTHFFMNFERIFFNFWSFSDTFVFIFKWINKVKPVFHLQFFFYLLLNFQDSFARVEKAGVRAATRLAQILQYTVKKNNANFRDIA